MAIYEICRRAKLLTQQKKDFIRNLIRPPDRNPAFLNMIDDHYRYSVFGLVISTNREFSNLTSAPVNAPSDIELHAGQDSVDLSGFDYILRLSYDTATSSIDSFTIPEKTPFKPGHFCYQIRYWGGIEFVLNADGSQVWAYWPDDSALDLVAAYFFGPILGLILRLRGVVCLHASVINLDGNAIAFIAPSGGGKSTIAAALTLRGYPVISDDVLALDLKGESVLTRYGGPGVRLFEDSVEALITEEQMAQRLVTMGDKQLFDHSNSTDHPVNAPLPLLAIYTRQSCAEDPDNPEFETIYGSEALMMFLSNTYPGSYYRLPKYIRARELASLTRISRQIPLRGVRYRRKLDDIPVLCDAIIEDAKMLIQTGLRGTGSSKRLAG